MSYNEGKRDSDIQLYVVSASRRSGTRQGVSRMEMWWMLFPFEISRWRKIFHGLDCHTSHQSACQAY